MTNEAIRNKTLSYLGLARRCGKLSVGSETVLAAIRKSKHGNITVILSEDASDRTKKQISDKCAFYGVPLITPGITGDEMASAAGKKMTVSVTAVSEKNLAEALNSLFSDSEAE